MLQLKNISFSRGKSTVLQDISLEIPAGDFTAILGANGAGKSTLLTIAAGELTPSAGQVRWGDVPLSAMNTAALARKRVVLPQNPGLNFNLMVDAVITMGAYPFPELSPAEVAEQVQHAAHRADVTHLLGRCYPSLSGGEQQRVQFARAMVQILACYQSGEYRCLLLDEPTASLDPLHQHSLLSAAKTLALETGIAVVAVLHDVNLAARYCTRIAMLANNSIIASGIPSKVLRSDFLEQTYDLPVTVLPHPKDAQRPLVLFA
ncbi:heme ABC transporter ATP-binding protein [Deefgea tanakiae]|uniref:Heme ABC transporter ATP-binding protein n=1 Tax=Deefgea tanakiae TaxID=2865840 RepID=A0ABX8Z601_9NEIS|nr:heme ABC transporter ATP-binding protein [Deefgea tanakiae]QZA78006.1 heme ABC transporter ATP-binding protein [Deefgea tanakiae]